MTETNADGERVDHWRKDRGYVPIRDYGLLGDCHGAALVASDGSVDWLCAGRFDAVPMLWRILDAKQGAMFQIAPTAPAHAMRSYLPDTNVICTEFDDGGGHGTLTDFMPVGRAHRPEEGPEDFVHLYAPGWLIRVVECRRGEMEFRACFDAGQSEFDPGVGQRPHARIYTDAGETAPGAEQCDITFTLKRGERRVFLLAAEDDKKARQAAGNLQKACDALLSVTKALWQEWCELSLYDGRFSEMVQRSALCLKALTYAPSGAIVAAPTTSLPETLGGARNWDYRYSWLRDSAFVLHALAGLGYKGEAARFCEFLGTCCVQTLPGLQVLYGIEGHTDLSERRLDHLDGYAASRPVRIGNAATAQVQLDIYGEVADWAHLYHTLGGPLDATLTRLVRELADHVCHAWKEPDQGIWEMRGPPQQFVHGKLLAWVAMDRALQLLGDNPRWAEARDAILAEIKERGLSPDGGHLVQAYGSSKMDAALLQASLLAMPIDPSVIAGTVGEVERQLREDDYVWRYRGSDNLPGEEGAFLICSFWLVDALLVCERPDEARTLFESLLAKANDLGLYAEEMYPGDGQFLGNFPQAFTHLALINSALLLDLYEEGGADAIKGSHADRAKRTTRRAGDPDLMADGDATPPGDLATDASILDLDAMLPPRAQ